jgi:hypothetical protein
MYTKREREVDSKTYRHVETGREMLREMYRDRPAYIKI